MDTTIEYEQPKITNNQLKDINDWIDLGDIVVLKSEFVQYIYHDCEKAPTNPRYILINCNGFPSLLNEDEWPDYLQSYGKEICKCQNITKQINNAIKLNASNVFQFAVPKML